MKLPVKYDELSFRGKRRVREEYIKQQNGLCMFCNSPLSEDPPEHVKEKKINWSLFPDRFLEYPVHLQHNHINGLTEGAVHAYCNAVMWQYHGR